MREQIEEISNLQFFAIVLVVLGHCDPIKIYPLGFDLVHSFIYSFHMPLFMAISGFLFTYNDGMKLPYLFFIKKKFMRLILPYIFLSSVAFMPKVLLSQYALRPIDFSLFSLLNNYLYPYENVIGFFWFLPTLFLIFLLAPMLDIKKYSNIKIIFITIFLAFVHFISLDILLLNISGAIKFFIYFWIGCLIAHYKQLLHLNKNIYFSIFCFVLLILLNSLLIENQLKLFFAAILGIFFSFSFSYQIKKISKYVEFFYGYSYQIYLLSWFPQIFISIVSYKILNYGFYTTGAGMFVFGLLIPVFIAKYIKNKKIKFLIGL